jgi:methionyl-tRNA formyltransferase
MHKAAPKVDSGPMLAQTAAPILPGDTAGTLTRRLVEVGMTLLPQAVDALLGDSPGIPIDMTTSSYRTSIGHRPLDEAGSPEEAERMVRAGTPNMLPWVMRDGRAAYVSAARVANGASPDGVPLLHFPSGDLLLLETMDTCGCHHNTNDCAHRRSQGVTGR